VHLQTTFKMQALGRLGGNREILGEQMISPQTYDDGERRLHD